MINTFIQSGKQISFSLCDHSEGDHVLNIFWFQCNFLKTTRRRRHHNVTDLNQLFKTVSIKKIPDFVYNIANHCQLN